MIKGFIFFIAISLNIVSADKKDPEITAYTIMRDLSRWDKDIESILINFSLNHSDENNKIKKVERRKLSYIKKNNMFLSLRYEMLHPEKIIFLVASGKYQKYNSETKVIEDEFIFNQKSKEVSADEEKNFLKAVDKKIEGLIKDIDLPGASIPNNYRHHSVFSRAKINQEVIYKNRQCYVISAKSSNSEGIFWIAKDNNNLLRYVITNEDNTKQFVEVSKRKKISDTIYLPLEVTTSFLDENGAESGKINIKYYGYMINRKLPPKNFEL